MKENEQSHALDVAARAPLSPALYSGFTGIAWTLERLPRFEGGGPAARCLTRVLDRLEGLAERSPTGICWFTPPRFLPPGMRRGQSQLL